VWFVLGLSAFLSGLGIFFSVAAAQLQHASGVLPAAMACGMAGALGFSLFGVVRDQERRIQELERNLHDRQTPGD
jgi:hypothetical protein